MLYAHRKEHTLNDEHPPITYWAFWHEANGSRGHRRGPFHLREDAVRRMTEDLRGWAASLEHGTGAAGEWGWDLAHQVATLYRGDHDIPLGYYVLEPVVPDARTDNDITDPVEVAALRAASKVDAIKRTS